MSTLPQGWDSDYDGSRWFFIYRPTGQIQYHFPKPGDEFPDFIDSFAPAPALLPEEKLESQQQVKRRSTTGSSSRAKAAAHRQREASALPVVDDEGGFEYSFESFGYLGPQSYNDVSPLNDDEEEDLGPGRADKLKEGVGKDSPANTSTPGERPRVSPMTSAGTTPQVGNTEPASGTPILGEPVMGESSTVHTIAEEPIMSEPIMSGPVLGVNTAGIPPQGPTHGSSQSPTVPMLDGTEISPPPAPAFSPVGYMPELYSESTAQCHEESNPPPVELPDNAIWVEPIQTVGFINEHPVELPTQHSPVEKRPQEPLAKPVGSNHQASAQQTQYPYGISASFASVSPPAENVLQKPVESRPQAENYQPWKPNQQTSDDSTKRGSVILGNMSIAESQRNDLGALANRRSPGSPTPPPKIDPANVPAVLAPPKVPPKKPIEEDELGGSSSINAQRTGGVHPLMPGAGARHASISNPLSQVPGAAGLSHFPSVLKPGPRQGLDRTGGVVPSDQPFQPQQKPYMAYQPAHPIPGVPPVSYAQLIQPRQYQAMPPSDSHPNPLRPGSGQQFVSEPRPGVPRTNTVSNQLPSQAPPSMLRPPPGAEPDGQQGYNPGAALQGPSLGVQRLSPGNIHSSQLQQSTIQNAETSLPPVNGPVPTVGTQDFVVSDVAASSRDGLITGQPSLSQHQAFAGSTTKADRLDSHPAQSGQSSGNHQRPDSNIAAPSPPSDTAKSQPHNSPAQNFVISDSIFVQGPIGHDDASAEPQPTKGGEFRLHQALNPLNDTEPSAGQSSTALKLEHPGMSRESGPGERPNDAESLAARGEENAASISVHSDKAVTKDTILDPMPVLSEKSAQMSQISVQPAAQELDPDVRKQRAQAASNASAQLRGHQHPQVPSQSPLQIRSTPEMPNDGAALVQQISSGQVRQDQILSDAQRISSPPTQPNPSSQETPIRHPSQVSQQSYGPQPVSWVQTSQMPPAPRNAHSPVGPWSVANLPGMAVLQPNAPPLRSPEQSIQQPSTPAPVYHQASVQQPHVQSPPARPTNQPDQPTASRNDARNTAPQSNASGPKSNANAGTHQSFSPQAKIVTAQSQPPASQVIPPQRPSGQVAPSTPTPAGLPQQSPQPVSVGVGRQQQGPSPQQPTSAQGQRIQSPGAVSLQNHPQAMVPTPQPQTQFQSQPQHSQLGQPQMIMRPRQQSVPGQQAENLPRVSLPSSSVNAQSQNSGMPLNGSLPLRAGPAQQTGISGGFSTMGPAAGSSIIGNQVSTDSLGNQPLQQTSGMPSGPQLASEPISQQPGIKSQTGPPIQHTRPIEAQAVPFYGNPGPPAIQGQRTQMQGTPRPQIPSQHTGLGTVSGQAGSLKQPQLQMTTSLQTNAPPSMDQYPGQNMQTTNTGNPVPPPQMQTMQMNPGTGAPPGQIPYNPRMFPPMPTPLITQPFNGQQPSWGQSGTPTQFGPQSPSSQRRASQQSIPPASPSSRRASGYQIQPGTQSPVITQQYQFPQSQAPSSSTQSAAGKEKNWFSKMWKNPGNKKGSVSGGSIPSANMGMNGAAGNASGPPIYDQTRPGPNKLQKSQLPPGPHFQQQPQGYPMAYNVPAQISAQMQGQPRPYGQPLPQNMMQHMPGQPPNFQASSNQMQSPIPPQRGNVPPPGSGPGAAGYNQQASQGVPVPYYPHQLQNNNPQGVHQGSAVGHSGQQPLPGHPGQPSSGQAPPNQMLSGVQSHAGQPPNAQQQWSFNQGAMGGASGVAFVPNAALQQNQGAQYQAQPQAAQFTQQQSNLTQEQSQSQQGESEDFAAAVTAVAGAIGTMTAANAGAPTVDSSCVVAPLFSGTGQPASIPAPVDNSLSGDSGYAVVDTADSVSVDVETVSIDTNGNAWTTTSVDYEGNDWGGTW